MVNIEIVDFETVIEVSNFEKSVKYYTEVLGFNLDWTWPDEGKKVHGSISIGGDSNDHSKKHMHVQISQAEHDFSPSGWLYIRIGSEIDQLYEYYKARKLDPKNKKEDDKIVREYFGGAVGEKMSGLTCQTLVW
ncbi:MAG: VOC family protein [Candidatus Kariarchaeum pelagius]